MDNRDYREITVSYYDLDAEKYRERNKNIVNFDKVYEPFLKRVNNKGKILDFGCGAGRDSLYFREKGYEVSSIDGSKSMCKIAEELLGTEVKQQNFEDFSEENMYDGIWACACLLHLPEKELIKVLEKLNIALKNDGYLFVSFKYGTFNGYRDGRYYNDMTEEKFDEIIKCIPQLEVVESYYHVNVNSTEDIKWLNIILKKQ